MFESVLAFMYLPLIMLGLIGVLIWIVNSVAKQLKGRYETANEIHNHLGFIIKHKYKYTIFWIALFGFIAFASVTRNNTTTEAIERPSMQSEEKMNERVNTLHNSEIISNDSLQESIEECRQSLEEYMRDWKNE